MSTLSGGGYQPNQTGAGVARAYGADFPSALRRALWLNVTRTVTAEVVEAGAAIVEIAAGDGAHLPAIGPDECLYGVLYALMGGEEYHHEVVRIVARVGDVLTVERAREGTQAREWPTGTPLGFRVTAGALAAMPLPVGAEMVYWGKTPPEGWLEMDGRGLQVASYPRLAAVLGDRFGGDGVDTFALPSRKSFGDQQPMHLIRAA
jgi:hypothetical protein